MCAYPGPSLEWVTTNTEFIEQPREDELAHEKTKTPTAISATVNASIGRQEKAETAPQEPDRDPSPTAWGGLKRRFRKLEKRSPAIAALPTTAPIFHSNPTIGAHADVTRIDSTTPRIVFDGPSRCRPSRYLIPKSSG